MTWFLFSVWLAVCFTFGSWLELVTPWVWTCWEKELSTPLRRWANTSQTWLSSRSLGTFAQVIKDPTYRKTIPKFYGHKKVTASTQYFQTRNLLPSTGSKVVASPLSARPLFPSGWSIRPWKPRRPTSASSISQRISSAQPWRDRSEVKCTFDYSKYVLWKSQESLAG